MDTKNLISFYEGLDRGEISFSFYYQSAIRFYNQTLNAEKDLLAKEEQLRQESPVNKRQNSNGYIYVNSRKEFVLLDDLSKATQIFSFMSIESFLNFYGVARHGESAFSEKESIHKKFKTLMASSLKNDQVISDKEKLYKTLKRMSNRRNELVHPKAKQEDKEGGKIILIISSDSPKQDAQNMVEDMKLFFKLFKVVDPETSSIIDYLVNEYAY